MNLGPCGFVLHLGVSDGKDVIESSHAPGASAARWPRMDFPPRFSKTSKAHFYSTKPTTKKYASSTMICTYLCQYGYQTIFQTIMSMFFGRNHNFVAVISLLRYACWQARLVAQAAIRFWWTWRFECASLGSCCLTFFVSGWFLYVLMPDEYL